MEDIFTVFVLVVLPAIFGEGAQEGGGIWMALGVATLKIGTLIAFTFVVGGWVIPRLLGYIAKTGSRELFTLGVLASPWALQWARRHCSEFQWLWAHFSPAWRWGDRISV